MGEEDGKPQASPSSDEDDPPGTTCEYCGTAIETNDWYPVTKDRDPDGSIRLRPFCSEDCQKAWLDEQSE